MKNKTIDLFGTKYRIEYVDSIKDENGSYWGMTYHDRNLIQVATKTPSGSPVSEENMKLTLLHELIHAILSCGAYHSECDTEPLVEWLARCIMSLQKQKII